MNPGRALLLGKGKVPCGMAQCRVGLGPRPRLVHPRHPRRATPVVRFSTSETSAPPEDQDLSFGECSMAYVAVDNKAHPSFTVLNLEVDDYPGLLALVCWVLNGMSVRVHNGVLDTSEDGQVKDTLWLTDFSNRKLKDSSAESLAERLQDFLVVCAPQARTQEQTEWKWGWMEVSNSAHEKYTQVLIRGEPYSNKPGFLLELSSALTSVGASIQHGIIQGSADAPQPVAEPDYDFSKGRYFQFLLADPKGGKLDVDRISSLVFTLGLIGGRGAMPTTPPSRDAMLNRYQSSSSS